MAFILSRPQCVNAKLTDASLLLTCSVGHQTLTLVACTCDSRCVWSLNHWNSTKDLLIIRSAFDWLACATFLSLVVSFWNSSLSLHRNADWVQSPQRHVFTHTLPGVYFFETTAVNLQWPGPCWQGMSLNNISCHEEGRVTKLYVRVSCVRTRINASCNLYELS